MRIASAVACLALSWTLAGCGDSAAAHSGLGEPIVVHGAQFFEGAFPADKGGPTVDPRVSNNDVRAGMTGKKISGVAGAGAQSVAVAFQGLGHGYWVLPTGAPDPNENNDVSFNTSCDLSRDLPPGDNLMIFAAADVRDHFGTPALLKATTAAFRPRGHLVASLSWGNNADLDLHIVGPSGKELDPKHPSTTEIADGGADAGKALPGGGKLDRDSNGACVNDGYRNENVVWATDELPEIGSYAVRVDMFSGCGVPAASFTFTLTLDGAEILSRSGRLLDIDADGGGPGSGLFIGEFSCAGDGTCS